MSGAGRSDTVRSGTGSTGVMIAVIVVRNGELPLGAVEASLEAEGHAFLIGDGLEDAARELGAVGAAQFIRIRMMSLDDFGAIANAAAAHLSEWNCFVCPASPDGRDLAPRLAHALGLPLFTNAIKIRHDLVTIARAQGHVSEELNPGPRFVATLTPGVRGTEHRYSEVQRGKDTTSIVPAESSVSTESRHEIGPTVQSLAVDPPDPSTMDLTEAKRIVGGGQGLGSTEQFFELGRFATAIGASLGGTRVASDAGWIPFERQIGTTGVIVHPDLYLAFAISGATQHTTGLGDPAHIISVNLDPSCPMMAMADLAIVSDANAVIDALNTKLTDRLEPCATGAAVTSTIE